MQSSAESASTSLQLTNPAPARLLLDPRRIHPRAATKMASFHPAIVQEVESAIAASPVVVLGMAQNPHVKKVRQALTAAGVPFAYVEYGSYFSKWRERLAIKVWSGWPTFPQVFVHGVLVGGEDLTRTAIGDGTLRALIASGRKTG